MSDINSSIDAMVSQSATAGAGAPISQRTTADLRLNFDGTVELIGKPVDAPALEAPAAYTAVDQLGAMAGDIDRIQNELAEGVFDSRGNRQGDRYTGRDRDVRQAQLTSLLASAEFQMRRGLDLADATANQKAANERATAEQVAALEYSQGDPAKAALLAKEIEQAEARRVAEAIVSRRRGQ